MLSVLMTSLQKKIVGIAFLFSICIFLAHFLVVKTAVYGDGRYYYSYLTTIVAMHSFNFSSSFHYYGLPFLYTPTHFLQNPHTIGPAVVWTIPYLLGFSITSVFRNSNPFNVSLQIPIGIWNIFLVFLGLYTLYLSLKKFFTKNTAFLVTLTTFFATNLFFYGAIDVLNSHSTTFFFSALFIYLWVSSPMLWHAFLLGISLGMLILTRTQDAIFSLLPLITLIEKKRIYIFSYMLLLLTTTLILLPQFFLWHILWGGWLKSPYLYGATFSLFKPNIFGVLFNFYDGLFLWTPITIVGFVGLFIFAKQERTIAYAFLCIFFLTLYLISTFEIWWGGASFSSRYFISILPILAFGVASFYEKYISFKNQIITSFIFSVLNIVLIFFFLLRT